MNKLLKTVLILTVICILSRPAFHASAFFSAGSEVYARIETDAAILYIHNPEDGELMPVTTLPKTHFVRIESDYSTAYYSVAYRDLSGYMQKSAVETVGFEPLIKDAVGALTVTADVSAVPLRVRPDHRSENIVCEIPKGETLSYYGALSGTAAKTGGSTDWYFVLLDGDGAEPLRGYLYSEYITVTEIPQNPGDAVRPEQSGANEESPGQNEPEPEVLPLPAAPPFVRYLTIAALTVPAVVIMILLFQKPKEQKQKRRKRWE